MLLCCAQPGLQTVGLSHVSITSQREMAEEYVQGDRLDESAPNLLLMDQMKMLQWRVYDQTNEEWVTEWEETNKRPSLMELNVQFLDGSNPIAVVFWIPTVVNPEQIARSLNTGGAGGAAGGRGGPGGDRGQGDRADGGRGGRGDGPGGGRGAGADRGRGSSGGRGASGGGGRPAGGQGGGRASGGVPGVPGAGGGGR